MNEQWFDNQAGLVDYLQPQRKNSYETMNFSELATCLRKEELALIEHKRNFKNTTDAESAKAMKRCSNRMRVIRMYMSKINNFGVDDALEKEFRDRENKLKNIIAEKDKRINKLLKDVAKYKQANIESTNRANNLKNKLVSLK